MAGDRVIKSDPTYGAKFSLDVTSCDMLLHTIYALTFEARALSVSLGILFIKGTSEGLADVGFLVVDLLAGARLLVFVFSLADYAVF